MFIYNHKDNIKFNVATITIAAEIRNLIQNWCKENKLPIDFRVPCLKVYFTEPIIKTAMIEGITEAQTDKHLFEACQVNSVEFEKPMLETGNPKYEPLCKKWDIVFWSPLGGTIGYGNVLDDALGVCKYAIEHKAYNEY